jgi:DNA ligase-associated metallophosphoesterase
VNISITDQTIDLLPGGLARLSDGSVVVADLHLGKATAFQARGLAIPEGDSAADLNRLRTICEQVAATRLLINGDLFHSPAGLSPEIEQLLEDWLASLSFPVQLILGNHDRALRRVPASLQPVDSLEAAGFLLVHDPAEAPAGRPTIAAHWHPVAKIADGKRSSLRLPCFLARGDLLVQPAFGSFTGGVVVAPEPADRFFVAPADRVIEVPAPLLRR